MIDMTFEEKFDEEAFTYKASKDKKVFIFWHGKQVMMLKGKDSDIFLEQILGTDFQRSQLIMAKVTGNFKQEMKVKVKVRNDK